MSFNHEAVAALPVASNADKALIRALCTRRFAYTLDTSESAANFVAADPATGVIPLNLIQNNILFLYDSTDTTTTADGVTCLVSNDGKRFKAATVAPPYSVLTRTTIAEPTTPAVGDAYLIPTAATGADWAGKDGQIGTYTARGWVFVTMPIGCSIYVKDANAFYYRNAAGTWTAGVGSIAIGAGGVNITNVLGANASFEVRVENQTTNAPPSSPTTPTAYIIGSSPTGSWSGNAARLAICLVAGAFTIITPQTGDAVYDKSLNTRFTFNGTAWVSSGGGWAKHISAFTQASGGNSVGTGTYTYSITTAPTSASGGIQDTTTLTYTAKSAAANLFVDYSAVLNGSASPMTLTVGLLKDSGATVVAWDALGLTSGTRVSARFKIAAADLLSHTYTIQFFNNTTGNVISVSHRLFELEEESV